MINCPECQPSTLTIHGEKILRDEIKSLHTERDTAEANLERLQNKFEQVTGENGRLSAEVTELRESLAIYEQDGSERVNAVIDEIPKAMIARLSGRCC